MRKLQRLALGLISAATLPAYLGLAAFAVKSAPLPRDVAWPLSVLVLALAAATFLVTFGRVTFGRDGWAHADLGAPADVCRQLRRVCVTLAVAGLVLMLPLVLISKGLIAPGGRPIAAGSLSRLLSLSFEVVCWVLAYRLLRRKSPLLGWLAADDANRLGWAGRQRWAIGPLVLLGLAGIVGLDVAGYHFTAFRLIYGIATLTTLVIGCWALHQSLTWLINHHAWKWTRSASSVDSTGSAEAKERADDAAAKLRKLTKPVVILVGVMATFYLFNVDLALFRYLGDLSPGMIGDKPVTVGDVARTALILFATVGVWRNTQTFFTVVVFPRLADDPGIRYAVVTLCRYAVLAIGLLAALSSVHLGMEKIGVVLAALGVGLGFGLQEIVSNFVSGIILLLERPIRVGDLVTVGGTTGSIDRINIRATTIINGDNQSMIVPNRAFITGNLVNWTHKDKIVRVAIRVNVALGTDADKVTDLLLSIAHGDVDVLNNPVSNAMLDAIGPAALDFVLYAYVPEPSVMGRVRHRLNGEIQRRFAEAGIVIPLPAHEIHLQAIGGDDAELAHRLHPNRRHDPGTATPAHPPHIHAPRGPLPAPAEPCHRGVDE